MTTIGSLNGRTALITGAAGNIGRAVAVKLAAEGAMVIASDHERAAKELTATANACREVSVVDGGDAARTVTFDVTDRDAVAAAVAAGPLPDLVFNNAGYQGMFCNILDADAQDFEKIMAVNVTGVFNVLQATAQALNGAGRFGSIVNTASMAGVSGAPNMGAYSTSKAAVIGLTKSAAKDLAPFGIRVNAISPGFIGPGVMWDTQVAAQAAVESPYYADDPAQVAEQMVGMVPLGRVGSLEEVADVTYFLLSDLSSFLTGTNTEISGGGA